MRRQISINDKQELVWLDNDKHNLLLPKFTEFFQYQYKVNKLLDERFRLKYEELKDYLHSKLGYSPDLILAIGDKEELRNILERLIPFKLNKNGDYGKSYRCYAHEFEYNEESKNVIHHNEQSAANGLLQYLKENQIYIIKDYGFGK